MTGRRVVGSKEAPPILKTELKKISIHNEELRKVFRGDTILRLKNDSCVSLAKSNISESMLAQKPPNLGQWETNPIRPLINRNRQPLQLPTSSCKRQRPAPEFCGFNRQHYVWNMNEVFQKSAKKKIPNVIALVIH